MCLKLGAVSVLTIHKFAVRLPNAVEKISRAAASIER